MKILLAAGLYPPDIGGPATYAKMLEEKLPSAGIELVVVQYGLVRSLPKFLRHVAYFRLLWRQSRDCEVIYALDPMSVGLPARLVAWLRRMPFLVRLGGDYAWEQGVQRFGVTDTLDEYLANKTPRPWPVHLMAGVQNFVVRGAKVVIVPSQYLKGVVASWGVPLDKIQVVYSALHPLGILDDRLVLREDFLFSGTVLVSAGRLTPWKGFRTLIDLVATRISRGEIITLVIIGDGPDKENLMAYAKQKNVTERIRFVGSLTRDAMAAVIKAADIFVYNTAYEGLSHQLLEVMDIGTPMITTNIGGNPELITNGVEGILVSVNDLAAFDAAVSKLVTNTSLGQRYVTAAKQRVALFKSDTVIEQMAVILKKQF